MNVLYIRILIRKYQNKYFNTSLIYNVSNSISNRRSNEVVNTSFIYKDSNKKSNSYIK